MTNPSVTYTFTNSTASDAGQVNQNFTDIINAMTDGTKTFNIDALTCAGAATFNGAVTLGNATGDTITLGGYISGSIIGNTTAGVPWKGRTDGSAVSAGYVGQILEQAVASGNYPGNNTWQSIASVTLTPGVWVVDAITTSSLSGATCTGCAMGVTATVSSGTGIAYNDNGAQYLAPTSGIDNTACVSGYIINTSAASTVYYLNIIAYYSAGTPKVAGRIRARRVA